MQVKQNLKAIILITLTAITGKSFASNPRGNPIFRDVFTANQAAMKEIQIKEKSLSILYDKDYSGNFTIAPYEPECIEIK